MGKNVIISTLPNISQNYLPKVNSSNIFANSLVYDDGSSVLINTTTASAFKLDVNGSIRATSGTLTGALSGTSATFSGNAAVGGTISSWAAAYRALNIGAGFGIMASNTNYDGYILSNAYYDGSWKISNNASIKPTMLRLSDGFSFQIGTTAAIGSATTFSEVLGISNTGAATFSSSVTAGTNFRTDGGSVQVGAGSNNYYTRIITEYNYPYVDSYLDSMAGSSWDGRLTFRIQRNGGAVNPVLTILPTGSVGIGTSSPNKLLEIASANSVGSYATFRINAPYYNYWDIINDSGLAFSRGGSEFMRITSGGYLKASNDGTYRQAGTNHEFRQTTNGVGTLDVNHSGTNPYGLLLSYSGADPNNTTNWLLRGYSYSSGTDLYFIYSNGTTGGRSHLRWKKNIEPARNGYLDDLSKLEVVKYNWYNQSDDDAKELGLIAQQVENVFPGLVVTNPCIKKKEVIQEDGTIVEEEYQDGDTKSIKFSVIQFMLLKGLQEANSKIQELKAELDTLKNK